MNRLGDILEVKRNTLHIEGNHKIPRVAAGVAQTCPASVCFPLINSGRQL